MSHPAEQGGGTGPLRCRRGCGENPCACGGEEHVRALVERAGPGWGTFASEYDATSRDALEREFGLTISQIGGLAPFQISGVVDGHEFYVRERHDIFTVEIAAREGEPFDFATCVLVAEGSSPNLYGQDGERGAVRTAVTAIRRHLRARSCQHEQPRDARHLFCGWCGEPIGQ